MFNLNGKEGNWRPHDAGRVQVHERNSSARLAKIRRNVNDLIHFYDLIWFLEEVIHSTRILMTRRYGNHSTFWLSLILKLHVWPIHRHSHVIIFKK